MLYRSALLITLVSDKITPGIAYLWHRQGKRRTALIASVPSLVKLNKVSTIEAPVINDQSFDKVFEDGPTPLISSNYLHSLNVASMFICRGWTDTATGRTPAGMVPTAS